MWATLFGLLFWDVLLEPVPDVFRTPFQAGLSLGGNVRSRALPSQVCCRLLCSGGCT